MGLVTLVKYRGDIRLAETVHQALLDAGIEAFLADGGNVIGMQQDRLFVIQIHEEDMVRAQVAMVDIERDAREYLAATPYVEAPRPPPHPSDVIFSRNVKLLWVVIVLAALILGFEDRLGITTPDWAGPVLALAGFTAILLSIVSMFRKERRRSF